MPGSRVTSLVASATALALLAACTGGDEATETPATVAGVVEAGPSQDPAPPPLPDPEPEPDPEPCRRDVLEARDVVDLSGTRPSELALEVAERTHRCAEIAVVVRADDHWAALLAVPIALASDAPLLLAGPDGGSELAATLDDLAVEEVITVGTRLSVPGRETVAVTAADDDRLPRPSALAVAVVDHLGVDRLVTIAEADPRAAAAAVTTLESDDAVLVVPDDPQQLSGLAQALPATASLDVRGSDPATADALADRLLAFGLDASRDDRALWGDGLPTTWLVDPSEPELVAVAAVAARARGEAVLPVDGRDLRAGADEAARLRASSPDRVVLLGALTADATWQLPVVLEGPELPGGGFRLFEDHRMVALYGHPSHPELGALGQQDLDDTVARLREVAEPYGADGTRVVPAFELIATVASREAGEAGDYSRRTPIEELQPHVDLAAEEELYVILDLQPGRADFLTQAQEYEQLLRLPHVGLAIDPEWRLLAEQVHLEQIGSVAAEEVQAVLDWLAELTRHERLPQKLVVLHQFQVRMLPDRDTLVVPPELEVVVHMDGQGSQGAKDETYATITADAEDRWLWGWKNFYTEDEPLADPERVLALEPQPIFISYQ